MEDFRKNINIMSDSDSRNEGDFIDMYLDQIMTTEDTSSSFYHTKGLQSLDCVMIDLFIGIISTFKL